MGLAITVVEKATQYPAICMVRKTHTGPLVDLGMDFEPENTGRMYISVPVCKVIAEKVGYVDKLALDQALEHIGQLEAEAAALAAQVKHLEAFKASVETTFDGAGFTRRRRKKEEPVGA